MLFENRTDAGRRLAGALVKYKARYPVVLALPRGGVPVAYEVAKALDQVLADLNREPPRLLGNGPILSFSLSAVNQNPCPTDGLL